MPLSNSQMRAIELMIEQMKRLDSILRRARRLSQDDRNAPSSEAIVRDFYDENTRLGQFELNYLNAIGKCLAPNPDPADMTVVTEI